MGCTIELQVKTPNFGKKDPLMEEDQDQVQVNTDPNYLTWEELEALEKELKTYYEQ